MVTEVTIGRFRVWATRGGKRVASQNCGTRQDVKALKAEWEELGFEVEVFDSQPQPPEYERVKGVPIPRRPGLAAVASIACQSVLAAQSVAFCLV